MKRNGSALLIVLGVLSFLVVSAVAFSAYMRRARLPSSYLRRTVAAREIAKGALAHVIDEIDGAIANGAHPGIGGTSANTWRDRVFFRGGDEQDISQTAPTLTLEGLAYIPPPLVNEARYWSRKTPTAVWKSFGYDTGRFAYCAIDVSDYFDVNRLVANYPRSSAANRRITIAHLFEDANHEDGPQANYARDWDDKFMEQFRDIDKKTLEIRFDSNSKMPLISLADFNLALGANGSIGRIKSPFVEYLKAGTGAFYPGDGTAQSEAYAAMTFVTDGWFPKETRRNGNAAIETYDLADGSYQPFRVTDLEGDKSPLLSAAALTYIQQSSCTVAKDWYERLSGFGMAALADYLDENHVPISLAVPTTERVPMICGVEPRLAQKPMFGVERTDDGLMDPDGNSLSEDGGQSLEREVSLVVHWMIKPGIFTDMFQGGEIVTLVAYPFLHKDAADENTWTLDGKFVMFFTSESAAPFRMSNGALGFTKKDLPSTGIDTETGAGVITVKLDGASPQFKAITDEKSAIWKSPPRSLKLDAGRSLDTRFAIKGNDLLRVTYKWTQRREKTQSGGFTEWIPKKDTVLDDPKANNVTVVTAETILPALKSDGSVDPDFQKDGLPDYLNNELAGKPVKKVCLNAAVWLRIKDSGGNVVDMVPADVNCDKTQNSIVDPLVASFAGGSHAIADALGPLLKFETGVEFDFGIAGMKDLENSGKPISISPAAVMVPDPRHNHAPENWYSESADMTEDRWLESNLIGVDVNGNPNMPRDGDIFMATSDAGYLQSIYELAFLPRLTDLYSHGDSKTSGNYGLAGVAFKNWNNDNYAAKAEGTFNAKFMWRTYDPIVKDRDAFEDLPFTSEGSGMKVNPYSDSTNVLMAAFANTPIDWRHAHTNYDFSAALKKVKNNVAAFNTQYAWNEYSTGGAFAWGDLRKVAGKFMDLVRQNPGWKDAWNNIDWYDLCSDGNVFPDVPMDDGTDELWDVDRKFLYGFWRDCFAAKQQLFLIFIRAEPLMLGGGTADLLPPQLGARAVALVWRDPATPASATAGYPHRTRVLFYRPLD